MTLPALEQAITFLSRADLIATARQQSLPAGVTEVLKISSGDNEALMAAQESTRFSQEDVRHAAQFYVQQILFAPDSDHYRILGVDPDDAEAKIKLHYRLLVRWLHPDKNSSDWEVVFSDRVNRAWHSLRTPERRRDYDVLLESQGSYQPLAAQPSRKLESAQLHRNKVDERFMSSRTIKRLPVAVFGMLGVSAIFALWWLSQLQPNLQAPEIASVTPGPRADSIPAPAAALPVQATPTSSVAAVAQSTPEENADKMLADISPVEELPIKKDMTLVVQAAAKPSVKTPEIASQAKTIAAAIPQKTPSQSAALPANTSSAKTLPTVRPVAVAAAANEKKSIPPARQKNTTVLPKPTDVPVIVNVSTTVPARPVVPSSKTEVKPVKSYDANVKQFLLQFSRIYADGDYFALHNLFTKDLSILSAPPQRSVLRSYRQLFENSQSREIALDHVTWLANDENIVVIASYQTHVLPHGKVEAQSSRGDIRLDLRLENGQLKIIRLQSDTKNG